MTYEQRVSDAMLEEAYLKGFLASGPGWHGAEWDGIQRANGSYGGWLKERAEAIAKLKEEYK